MNRKPHSQLVKLELNLPIPEPAKEGIRSNVVPLVETMFKKSFKFYKGFLPEMLASSCFCSACSSSSRSIKLIPSRKVPQLHCVELLAMTTVFTNSCTKISNPSPPWAPKPKWLSTKPQNCNQHFFIACLDHVNLDQAVLC